MADLKIVGDSISQNLLSVKGNQKEVSGGFDAAIKEALSRVTTIQNEAEQAIKELASGGDITHAVIAMEKADMSFQVMVEVRNKLLSAYEEIMRMQV